MERADPPSSISGKEAISVLNTKIENWDFENYPAQASCWLALNISLWAVENFGQGSPDTGYQLSAPYNSDYRIPGRDLPARVQPLLAYTHQDEIFFGDIGSLALKTHYDYAISEHFIPNWESITAKGSFHDWYKAISSDARILETIKLGRAEFLPQVKLTVEPDFGRWGLEMTLNRNWAKAIPFGHKSEIEPAFSFAVGHKDKIKQLSQLFCELTILTCEHSSAYKRTIDAQKIEDLDARFMEEKELPIITGQHYREPGGMKDLMVKRLINAGHLEPPQNTSSY